MVWPLGKDANPAGNCLTLNACFRFALPVVESHKHTVRSLAAVTMVIPSARKVAPKGKTSPAGSASMTLTDLPASGSQICISPDVLEADNNLVPLLEKERKLA